MLIDLKKISILIALCISVTVLLSCASSSVSTSGSIKAEMDSVLDSIPADNAESEKELGQRIISAGLDGLNYVCSQIIPPGTGDDTKARYAISGLSNYTFRPGAETDRELFEEALIIALNESSDPNVKTFFISQLQIAGKNKSVPHLGKLLSDDTLYEPAARALISINTRSAEAEFIKALPLADDKKKVTIINALGDLRSKAAALEIQKYIASDDNNIRNAVMYALANIGPYSTDDILTEAAQSAPSYEGTKAWSYKLLYAERLAEAGKKIQCAELCRDIIKNNSSVEQSNLRSGAVTVLVKALGEDALWDLINNVDTKDVSLRKTILSLAHKIPGNNATIEWLNKENNSKNKVKRDIQLMLFERDKKYMTPGLEIAMQGWIDPNGFVPLFNGKNLNGWKGLVGDPISRSKMSPDELAEKQKEADDLMYEHWKVENGTLVFSGHGSHLCTIKDYDDFEMVVDWKIEPGGDSGIYLRGSPQVQIWDPDQWPEGSGGLYNNQNNPSKPLKKYDNPIGDWNNFRIRMIGDKVTVFLNNELVVDNVTMENYWDRNQPIFPKEQIELQSHGSKLLFKNVRIKELNKELVTGLFEVEEKFVLEDGFELLFNGKDLTGWVGDKTGYVAEDGKIVVHPEISGGSGNLYTEKEYEDFTFKFDFRLTQGANNGLGIRAPLEGDAAYVAMELQILENTADIYKDLKPYQYHGSIYGIVPAKRGYLHSVGSWNHEEVIVKGRHVTVILNGVTIVDADLDEAVKDGTMDGLNHPGLSRVKGHIGFLGHGSKVEFKNIRINVLK